MRDILRHKSLRTGAALFILTAGSACWPFNASTKNYANFTTYSFAQQPGLGFCGDASKVFAATLIQSDAGEIAFTPTNLRPSQSEADACETSGGFMTETGCMTPEPGNTRTLSQSEAEEVTTQFAKVAIMRRPVAECRTIAFDPCKIEEHIWDSARHTDYLCSPSRLEAEQSTALVDMLTRLRDAAPTK